MSQAIQQKLEAVNKMWRVGQYIWHSSYGIHELEEKTEALDLVDGLTDLIVDEIRAEVHPEAGGTIQ